MSERNLLKATPAPCGACPYRKDVPSGIWDLVEYDKLPGYDGETWEQSPAVFMCHRQDGRLCGGWLACHDTRHLLALRLHPVDASVFNYSTKVPVFGSGAEARAHGMREINAVGDKAARVIGKLERRRDAGATRKGNGHG